MKNANFFVFFLGNKSAFLMNWNDHGSEQSSKTEIRGRRQQGKEEAETRPIAM